MATITLKLDDEILGKLTEAARRASVTPERMAGMIVEAGVRAGNAFPAPGLGEPGRAWADASDRDGDLGERSAAENGLSEFGRPWSEVRPEFLALIDKTFGKSE